MAKSKFEYVKRFEQDASLLPNTWLVVRVDGRGFHKFTDAHGFRKPNDDRGLGLMNAAALAVAAEFQDVVLAYGESDEYSFVFRKETTLWNRREAKILTAVVSFFTAVYVMKWPELMVGDCGEPVPLLYPPQFDGRVVCYPSRKNIRDYLSWRQADCHINNLYNTCFWKLVLQGGKTPVEAEGVLSGTLAKDKNEILFSRFGVNYNDEPPMFRRGSIVIRRDVEVDKVVGGAAASGGAAAANSGGAAGGHSEGGTVAAALRGGKSRPPPGSVVKVKRKRLVVVHEDLIGDAFWEENTDIFPLEW